MKLYVLISDDDDDYYYHGCVEGVADSLEKAKELKKEYEENERERFYDGRKITEFLEVELNRLIN